MAINAAHTLLIRSRTDSFDCITKIFDSIIAATLLYAASIWAINYLELVEQVQLSFFKRIFCLPKNTDGALIRVELGRAPLALQKARLANKHIINISLSTKYATKITQRSPCPICNTGEVGQSGSTLSMLCPILKPCRDFYLMKDNLRSTDGV
ncbi:hypothetical protein KQX54_000676 [Cotesia glomerata]|uniref:Uncharacterized protein n=1 Tax=Cotesia glomerata TaxID=32391 RepID=A0AAV7I8C9_COTGL|nr:hypothetical protein KQX54_000676 [Cotesia glomerata]